MGRRARSVAMSLALSLALSTRSQATTSSLDASGMHKASTPACGTDRALPLASRRFVFPRDDGAHDGYAVEWWRTFGRVTDDAGKRFDFSVNVSRFAIDARASTVHASASRWFARHLVTTSYELLDEQTLEVVRKTSVDREDGLDAAIGSDGLSIVSPVLTYASSQRARSSSGHFAIAVRDTSNTNRIALDQRPLRAALPLGPGGLMRTGSCASSEAYAYAYTRNATKGALRFHGVDHRVSGTTWFEHEFAQRELVARDTGWSRFEIQFDDGRDIDARFAHDRAGNVVATSGAFVAADGSITYLTSASVKTTLPPDARERDAIWHSDESDVTYPAMWFFLAKPSHLGLATVEMTHDQEIHEPGRAPYYWGAIVVEKYGPPGGDPGHGFVELTGYATARRT